MMENGTGNSNDISRMEWDTKYYQYLRLGRKYHRHIVFELNPDKELRILVGEDERCIHSEKITEKGKGLLLEWVNKHLSNIKEEKNGN